MHLTEPSKTPKRVTTSALFPPTRVTPHTFAAFLNLYALSSLLARDLSVAFFSARMLQPHTIINFRALPLSTQVVALLLTIPQIPYPKALDFFRISGEFTKALITLPSRPSTQATTMSFGLLRQRDPEVGTIESKTRSHH